MNAFLETIRQMIPISEAEIEAFSSRCTVVQMSKGQLLSEPGVVPTSIFFILSGIVRVIVHDRDGNDHTVHFAVEHQFIADYSAFLSQTNSMYSLQALEACEMVVIPREAVVWGYEYLKYGDRLGRLVAEFYFIYQDNRIKNNYARTPKERYDSITDVFPNIHNRVPQHMIASYLGITPVHLSRLKKTDSRKV